MEAIIRHSPITRNGPIYSTYGTYVGGGVGVAHHPIRGVGKGFGAEGGFTRNEGGGH